MWHREGLIDEEIKIAAKAVPTTFKRFVDVVETRDRYYQLGTVGDMPSMSQIDELGSIPELSFETPFASTITPKSYKGKFKISVEAFLRDPHGLYDAVPVKLADSLRKSREQDCAGFLTRADDSAFVTTPDGVALASASHLNGPGVFSNILTGNAPLSYNAAQDAIIQGMQAPDYNGDNMQIEGPWQLVVAISNVAIAQNIKNTINGGYRYDTADREPNWVGGQIDDVVVVPYATSQLPWMLIAKPQKPLLLVNGLGVKTIYQENGDDASYNWSLTSMYALGARMPQGLVWSAGNGS